MATRTRNRLPTDPPVDGGAPPKSPDGLEDIPVDEGPMRRELLRQIAQLDAEIGAGRGVLTNERITPKRGPAIQATSELERIRDELLVALHGPARA